LQATAQTSPTSLQVIFYYRSKETYYSVKRDLLQCQKRRTTVSKETYYTESLLKEKEKSERAPA